jgi:hypothetical protein
VLPDGTAEEMKILVYFLAIWNIIFTFWYVTRRKIRQPW